MSTSFVDLDGSQGFPPIAVAFSAPPDPSVLTDPSILAVWRSSLLDFRGRMPVQGSWSVATGAIFAPSDQPVFPGTALVFTPTEQYLENCRYTVEISPRAFTDTGTSKFYLPKPVSWSWLSKLKPFFCDPYAVTQRLGRFADEVIPEVLYYEIWKASVTANRERMLFIPAWWGGPSVGNVVNWNFVVTYAVQMFTEIEATIQIMNRLIAKYTEEVDRKQSGLDFETSVEDGLIKNLDYSIKMLKREREPYYSEISSKRPKPRNGQKAGYWPWGPNHFADRSYTPRGSF